MLVVVMMIGVMISVPIVMGTTDGGAPSEGVKQPAAAATDDRRPAAAAAAAPSSESDAAVASAAAMVYEAGSGAEVCQGSGCRGGRGSTSNPDPGVHQTGLHAVRSQRNHLLSSFLFFSFLLLLLLFLRKLILLFYCWWLFRGLFPTSTSSPQPPQWLQLSSFMQRREAALVEGGNGGQRRAGGRQPAWICPESARIEGYPGDCKLLCLSARSVGVHTVVAMITRGRGEWERERKEGRKEERKEWGETEREPKKAAATAAVAEEATACHALTKSPANDRGRARRG